MESGALELLNPSRRLLVVAIKERGEATAEELAAASYLSVAAVRMHLAALERLGIVYHTAKRQGPGRPLHIYRLGEAGEHLFPQGYAGLLRQVLAAVKQSAECSQLVWAHVEEEQARALSGSVTSSSLEDRVAELARAGELRGFAPHVTPAGEGAWSIKMGHCPWIEAARAEPEICAAEARTLSRVLGDGVTVTSRATRLEGHVACSLLVQAPGARG